MNRAAVAGCLVWAGIAMAVPGCANACDPVVRDGWIRSGPPGMPMRAGFGRIANDCDAPLEITGATSPAFADVSLHETTDTGGVSRMREVEALRVPANGEAVLEPGGLHLMLADPQGEPARGSRVEILFQLRDGRTLRGEFDVR